MNLHHTWVAVNDLVSYTKAIQADVGRLRAGQIALLSKEELQIKLNDVGDRFHALAEKVNG